MKLAIIGAGIAGLTCAHEAQSTGHDVVVFDKGRGPGGRCSTRRSETSLGEIRFDHGAIGFLPVSDEFQSVADLWRQNNWVAHWTPAIGQITRNELTPLPPGVYYTGIPGMNGLVKGLCEALDVRFGTRISQIKPLGHGYEMSFEGEADVFSCDAIVSAAPPEQTAILLSDVAPDLAEQANKATSAPCWTAMTVFDAPLDLPYDLLIGEEDSPFLRCVRNASKPERGQQESWVLQASIGWSQAHIDHSKEDIAERLVTTFQTLTGIQRAPIYRTAHRWLYGFNARPVGVPASWDEGLQIGTCGDWHLGPDIEHAWLSGRVLGERLRSL